MTDLERTKAGPTPGRSRHAVRNAIVGGVVVGLAGLLAMFLLNRSPNWRGQGLDTFTFSPMSGILLVVAGAIGLNAITYIYLKRTDEHDVHANLWAMTVGALAFIEIPPGWWLLHHSGLVGPVNFWAIYFVAALISAIVWGWIRDGAKSLIGFVLVFGGLLGLSYLLRPVFLP